MKNREQLSRQDRLRVEYEYQVIERYNDAGFNLSGLKAVSGVLTNSLILDYSVVMQSPL